MSGNTCAVFNCADDGVKHKKWENEDCEIRKPQLQEGPFVATQCLNE